jgi:putative membrane protein
MSFLSPADKEALTAAVASVEERSSAEMVVVVRPQSGSYSHADLLAGAAAGLFTLWFQLFSPWEFSLLSILLGPLALGGGLGWLVSYSPGARRRLTREATRRAAVRTWARATFVERGVDRTQGRTGILLYVSLLERWAEVVADRGVEAAVPRPEWEDKVAALQGAVRKGEAGRVTAAHLRGLGTVLAAVLPRAEDDVDELADEVVA